MTQPTFEQLQAAKYRAEQRVKADLPGDRRRAQTVLRGIRTRIENERRRPVSAEPGPGLVPNPPVRDPAERSRSYD